MFVKMNTRQNIVEATDEAQGAEYTEVAGTVAETMPTGLLGFNGTVYTPNYSLIESAVVLRSEDEKSLDPYSDPDNPSEVEDMREALDLLGVNP